MKKGVSIPGLILSIVFTALITMAVVVIKYDEFMPLIADYISQPKAISKQSNDLTENDYNELLRLRKFIKNNYYLPTEDVDFTSELYKGLFESLDDPYSVYMTKEEFDEFNESSSSSYAGLGVQVSHGKDGLITVISPFEDTPAYEAGLKTGDKIIKVNGEDVFADQMHEAIKQMKGEPGTDVTITIMRGDEIFDVTITRDLIVLNSVKSRMLDNRIGYIRVTSFDNKVSSEFKQNFKQLKSDGATKLIIDLRNNPGGSLLECVKLADFILGSQLIVYTDDNHGHREDYKSDANKIEMPFVILVNGGSASASEILTGAVKDTHSGTIIGTTTFGKGLVQSVYPWHNGGGIKLTTAQYYTPNGTYIHGVGIEPNIIVEQSETYNKDEDATDAQLQEAIRQLNK